jgi:hypothetical protein
LYLAQLRESSAVNRNISLFLSIHVLRGAPSALKNLGKGRRDSQVATISKAAYRFGRPLGFSEWVPFAVAQLVSAGPRN